MQLQKCGKKALNKIKFYLLFNEIKKMYSPCLASLQLVTIFSATAQLNIVTYQTSAPSEFSIKYVSTFSLVY